MWHTYASQQFIFSISGWRANMSNAESPLNIDESILTCVYYGIKSYIEAKQSSSSPHIAIACDTRKSGIVLLMLADKILASYHCRVDNLGVIPGPAIMAYTKTHTDGFIYFTASHNPPEYNGIKFGSHWGKTQSEKEHKAMMTIFESYKNYNTSENIPDLVKDIKALAPTLSDDVTHIPRNDTAYELACKSYSSLVFKSVFCGIDNATTKFLERLTTHIREQNIASLGIIWDPNGGARTWKTDVNILSSLSIVVQSINTIPSYFRHDIIPEGASLAQASRELKRLSQGNQEIRQLFAVVSDCDGDRGNIIFGNSDNTQDTIELDSQEVFAIILKIELAWKKYIQSLSLLSDDLNKPIAVAVNGPSSLRCDIIAREYGASIERSEVGEANVIATGERLLDDGYDVALVGEASNGGTIMFPSTVRDPLCTVLSLLKGLLWADELQLDLGRKKNIMQIVHAIPRGVTTNTEDPLAKFQLSDKPYQEISTRILTQFNSSFSDFQKIFESHGIIIQDYRFVNYVGANSNVVTPDTPIKNGGLAIMFYENPLSDTSQLAHGYIWLRPSGTEPVVRIKADVRAPLASKFDDLVPLERDLLHRWRLYLNSVL